MRELLGHIDLIGRGGELTDTRSTRPLGPRAVRGAGVTTAAAVAVVDGTFADELTYDLLATDPR